MFTSLEGGFIANLDKGGLYDMVCVGFKNISKFEDYINDIKNGVYGKLISDKSLKILFKQKKRLKK